MRNWRSLAIGSGLVCMLAGPRLAHADAIGGCPQGQLWRSHPTSPGAMHHGGGECVPDPSASRCSASPRAGGASGSALAMSLALGAVVLGRRVRVRAR